MGVAFRCLLLAKDQQVSYRGAKMLTATGSQGEFSVKELEYPFVSGKVANEIKWPDNVSQRKITIDCPQPEVNAGVKV